MSDKHYINEKCPTCGKGRRVKVTGSGSFMLHIDRELFRSVTNYLTGQQILELASKKPAEQFALYQRRKGDSPLRVKADDRVYVGDDLHNQFVTLPLGQTQGAA